MTAQYSREGGHTLAVLGGSSPFTAALFDALAAGGFECWNLAIQGRDARALELIGEFAKHRLGPLGWSVTATRDRRRALDGADFVIHQVRYGGLEGRRGGEEIAARYGVPADETIGPAALRTAALLAPHLSELARDIRSVSPTAWVINLTNPVSITVALLAMQGVTRCLGVCEVPVTTARKVAIATSIPFEQLEWSYTGLNHRGFVHHCAVEGRDVMLMLIQKLGKQQLDGIRAHEIEQLGCVPTKYFRLMRAGATAEPRAAFLTRIRDQALRELRDAPERFPPTLGRRNLDWYSEATVPVLRSLARRQSDTQVVSVLLGGDIATERKMRFTHVGLEPIAVPPPPVSAQQWLGCFAEHERALLRASLQPSLESLEHALILDPVVPEEIVKPLAADVLRDVKR
jgi:6-phospho-beta-glucosidase